MLTGKNKVSPNTVLSAVPAAMALQQERVMKLTSINTYLATIGLLVAGTALASAQTDITTHANELTGTTLTANVYEQCDITVPTGVTFNVGDISDPTIAANASVTVTNIVLATATKQLKISVEAAAASFTPSVALAATWAAGDVSWDNGTSWTNATGAAGTLSSTSYGAVATGAADAAGFSTTTLKFTLAPNTSVKRSGNHTLALTWKVESIGS
jgi:hypothetical protein